MQANRPPSAFESRRLPLLLALAAGLLLAGLLTYFLFLAYEFYGAIAPGVFVGEVAVGGLTREQAAAKLEAAWNEQPIIALTGGEPPLMLYPAQVGLFVDAETSARAAWDVGRGAGRWSERLNRLLRGRDPVVVEPLVIYSHDAALRGLESVAATLGRSPQNARVEYIDQRWQAVEARYGQALDVNATLAALEADPLAVLYSRQLAARFIPLAPEVIDVSGLVADLEARRNIPLKIQGYDPISDETLEWIVPPEEFGPWIQIEMTDQGPQMVLVEAGVQNYLAGLQAADPANRSIGAVQGLESLTENWQAGQPIRVLLRRPETVYTVQPGDTLLRIGWRTGIPYWMIAEANPGLSADSIYVGQNLTIPSKTDLLPLPVVPGKRIIISIGEQRMWTYENGQPRNEWVISTGVDRSPTQPGVFQVQTHEEEAYASVWDLWMPHFLGIYEAWPGFMNGIHGLPTLSSGRRLWEGALGKPASYGCIILPLDAAADLYGWAEEGTVVEIRE